MSSGGLKHERGVGFAIDQPTAKIVTGYWTVSDRFIIVKLSTIPENTKTSYRYICQQQPALRKTSETSTRLWNSIKQCKSLANTIIQGYFNANVGGGRMPDIVGPYGLSERNDKGDRLVEWVDEHNMILEALSRFKQHKSRLWAWKGAEDSTKNQINFVLINLSVIEIQCCRAVSRLEVTALWSTQW